MMENPAAKPPKKESGENRSTVLLVVSGFHSRRMNKYVLDQQITAMIASITTPGLWMMPASNRSLSAPALNVLTVEMISNPKLSAYKPTNSRVRVMQKNG